VAVDGAGNEYVTGGGVQTDGSKVAFVAKYTAAGSQVYDHEFNFVDEGGNAEPTEAHGIAVDGAGDLYVVGTLQGQAGDRSYVVKICNDGTTFLARRTFGQRPAPNSLDGVALDQAGHVVATGVFAFNFFPTDVPLVFYADLNTDDLSTVGAYSYEISGARASFGAGIGVQPDGSQLAIAGTVVPQSGSLRALLLRVTDPVSGRASAAFIPSPDGDVVGTAAAVDAAGNDYYALTIPVPGGTVADVRKYAPGSDLFAPPLWEYTSTNTTTSVNALALGTGGTIYLTGSAHDANGDSRVLITQLLDSGDTVTEVGTALVGGATPGTSDVGLAVAVGLDGNALIVGTTTSPDFPVTDGSTLNGTSDAFLLNYGF
jgi:hypothetical protein